MTTPKAKPLRQVTVELPPPADWDQAHAYWHTRLVYRDDNGERTPSGEHLPGKVWDHVAQVAVHHLGVRVDFMPEPGYYDAGSMIALGVMFLAAAHQHLGTEDLMASLRAVVDGAYIGPPVVPPRREKPAA